MAIKTQQRVNQKDQTFTRRQFLTYQAVIETGVPVWTAMEAVASTAIEHPDWDMDEEMTWAQWRLQEHRAKGKAKVRK